MLDAKEGESLLELVEARIELKFAKWERERAERMFRIAMPLILVAYAGLIFAIVPLV